jgi:hypothetical protein
MGRLPKAHTFIRQFIETLGFILHFDPSGTRIRRMLFRNSGGVCLLQGKLFGPQELPRNNRGGGLVASKVL